MTHKGLTRNDGNPVDKHGDEWQWDKIKKEFDVEHPDGTHTNVGGDGEITHDPDGKGAKNMRRRPKSAPTPSPSPNAGRELSSSNVAEMAVGGAGAVVVIWWVGKILSPLCGPALPVCAVEF